MQFRRQLSRGQKLLITAPAVAAAALPMAQGVVIYTSVNGGAGLTIVGGVDTAIGFNPFTGTSFIGSAYHPSAIFNLYFNNYSDARYPILISGKKDYFMVSGGYVSKLSAGKLIDNSATFAEDASIHLSLYFAGSYHGPWAGGGNGYIGMRDISGNYGWANVTYVQGTSLTLYGLAYDDTGAGIQAGAVPEPADAALLGALVAGSAAAMAARRKRKLARAA